jgi:hypothetical protein
MVRMLLTREQLLSRSALMIGLGLGAAFGILLIGVPVTIWMHRMFVVSVSWAAPFFLVLPPLLLVAAGVSMRNRAIHPRVLPTHDR